MAVDLSLLSIDLYYMGLLAEFLKLVYFDEKNPLYVSQSSLITNAALVLTKFLGAFQSHSSHPEHR